MNAPCPEGVASKCRKLSPEVPCLERMNSAAVTQAAVRLYECNFKAIYIDDAGSMG